jgi:pimeloyl-ACP methyl ester carboxylesterase
MQVVVQDLLTTYDKVGKGPLILMLHGWGDSKITFKGLVDRLKSDYTILTLDLPGFGQTEAPQEVWNLDNYAQFVQAFLDKIDAKPKTIVAHSNGGALAIRGLAEHTLQTDKLVLIASAGIRNRQNVRRFVLKVVAKLGKLVTFWLPGRHKKTLQKHFYGTIGSDMLVAPHLQETFKITVRQDVQQDAKRLKLPVLLIYGESDKATPKLYGEIYRQLIPKSKLEIVPHAEHFVHQNAAEKVAHLIQEFIA